MHYLIILLLLIFTGCSSTARHSEKASATALSKGGERIAYPSVNFESYQPVEFILPKEELDLDQKCHALNKLREHHLISDQEFLEKLPFNWDF